MEEKEIVKTINGVPLNAISSEGLGGLLTMADNHRQELRDAQEKIIRQINDLSNEICAITQELTKRGEKNVEEKAKGKTQKD